MTSNHIDQLREWWESAEKGAPSKGDAIIRRTERLLSNGYAYEVGTEDYTDAKHLDNVRILARAPKPKPAWHDAVAVIAHTDDGHIRQVWERDGDTGYWCGTEGYLVRTEKLRDVTPLIEAKVTDETARTVLDRYYETETGHDWPEDTIALMRLAVTAALGLESA